MLQVSVFAQKLFFSCLMETLLQLVFGNRSLYSLDILTEYSGFSFELNIKMYDFLAWFSEKMIFHNISAGIFQKWFFLIWLQYFVLLYPIYSPIVWVWINKNTEHPEKQ